LNRIAPVAFRFFCHIYFVSSQYGVPCMFSSKRMMRVAGAVCMALLVSGLLSGCVIEPAWGPYYHHPYYRGY
jgi:hypothetical protein